VPGNDRIPSYSALSGRLTGTLNSGGEGGVADAVVRVSALGASADTCTQSSPSFSCERGDGGTSVRHPGIHMARPAWC
jgi:hypothetical protein